MAAGAFVRARIDEETKAGAASVLADFGLTVSDVVRMTLTRIALDGAIPFELKVPNAETRAAMDEARAMMRERVSRFATTQEQFDDLDQRRR